MKLTQFFQTDYVDYASYDCLRKVGSVVDGQKNAARKVLHTILEKNIKSPIKVSQLGSKVAEFTEYLHGNLDGVVTNLGQDFLGTNNLPLLKKSGNFGTRFTQDASASRYIFTHGTDTFFQLFSKEDTPVLVKQYFEGVEIEPMFFVPNLPILLINGSEGVASGYAQKILPRDPSKVKEALTKYLNGETYEKSLLNPWYKGFKGTITQGETPAQWIIRGVAKKIAANRVEITEVPVGYDLRGYLDVLDTLEDKKIIQSYVDKSEDDNFHFEVNINSKTLKEWDEETLLTNLKLIKRVSENYTTMDEKNKIKVFGSAHEILFHYAEVKLAFVQKRKEYQIAKLTSDAEIEQNKYRFIEAIIDGSLEINKRKKSDVELDLETHKFLKVDDSYNYLLNMNIMSLTVERMAQLKDQIKSKVDSIKKLKASTPTNLWLTDLSNLV